QIFEIDNAPGGGFTVKETGRASPSEPPPPGADPEVDNVYKQAAEINERNLAEMEEVVAASKTFTRDPVLINEFVSQTNPEARVYIDPNKLMDLWDKGVA